MLLALILLALWGAWIWRRHRTMHDPSKEEDDLLWELGDWKRIALWAAAIMAGLYLLRSGCASFVAAWGDVPDGPGAWFRFWRDWVDGVLLWPAGW